MAKIYSLLCSHLTEVKNSQEKDIRMKAHEFIEACGKLVQQKVIADVLQAKYCSIIVDTNPDSAHIEQTTFLLRFVNYVDGVW